MTDLHGNEALVFDYDAANQLASASTSAADAIRNQTASRQAAVNTAMTDFSGHYADLFRDNAAIAKGDADQLAAALDGLATITTDLIAAAHAEDNRRKVARDWYKQHDGFWNQAHDWFFGGGGKPPEGPKSPPATALPVIPKNSPRTTSGRGSAGSTTSGRPANLTSFVSTTSSLDSSLSPHQSKVTSLLHTFNQNTVWGQLDGYAVTGAFSTWLSANANDRTFASTTATAFEHAGGSGGLSTVPNSALATQLSSAGVNTARSDLDITMPQTYGFDPTTGYSLDPVNTATGNFIEAETDLLFAGGADLALTRMYNSMSLAQGAFGYGWSSLAEAGLAIDDEQASFTLADGRVVVFPRLGDGWDRPVSDNLWLATLEDGGHRVTGNDGSWWSCAADGRLTAYGVGAGTTVTLTYAEERLVEIAHERGRGITLSWQDGRVVSAETSDGRTATYAYDEQGHLLSVATPGTTRTYRWDTVEHLVTAVVDADGVVEAENAYDDQRRVRTQLTPHGRNVRFTYLPGRVTVIDDPDGTNANTWIADAKGRLIGVLDSEGNRQSSAYDARGNLVVVTERDGASTVHEYDERGRRTRTVTPGGADVQYAYDELDRITDVVAEAGAVTHYDYEGEERNPSRVVDPEGGVTRLTWRDGLLRDSVGPTGVAVSFGYDDHGDLTETRDADGNTARLEYDAVGRVVAAITPLGHRTVFDYDARGLLAQRTDPDGATWRFEHTAGGRLSATIDPLGARTAIEQDASGAQSLLVDPLDRRTELAHDAFGNLSSVTLPDGSAWTYTHDSLSRPVAATSPDGAVWSTSYDANGIPTGASDPTGVGLGMRTDRGNRTVETSGALGGTAIALDPLGRPLRTTGRDGGETVNVYDRCGRLVESVDAEGGLTRLGYDLAGRLTSVTTQAGATTSYAWDRCGRLAAAVSPTGGRTEYHYDADRRLTQIQLPTGETAEIGYDACGRVVTRRVPGIGSSSLAYDAAGRVTERRDPVNGRRRFGYDAAGQLIEAIDGNGGSTHYEYDLLGRAVAITDPLGGVTRRAFDSLNHCVAETDPLGRTMRAGYDPAGRQLWQENADGRRTEWTYDADGEVTSISVDGVVQSAYQRDLRARRLTIVDTTDADRTCVHELRWNGRRQLVSRSRDGQAITWTYDADGRRTSMTTPGGSTTRYEHDAAGHLTAVEHPLLGRATFDRDASGRLVAAAAGELLQSWEYADGFLAAHTVTGSDGAVRTALTRDASGRVTALERDGVTTEFGYDDACQLIAATTGDTATSWRYDAAGRLVAETTDGRATEHTYDAAGQLLSTNAPGRQVSYGYDAVGRRTSMTVDGATTTYAWNALGWLAGIASADGTRHTTRVDAIGELARVDGTDLLHDSAARTRGLIQLGDLPVLALGALTGIGSSWTTPGWRSARSTSATDPWALAEIAAAPTGLPGGLGIGGAGELAVAGLEWMNARVYDAASRGFLSIDPLDPVVGAGWAGNPYAYAGNDPLHAVDPLGLRPATDQDLTAWADAHQGTTVGHWLKDNWEYVAGGAMVLGGIAAMAIPGVGPIIGGALISAGADTIIQKATTGQVNWGEVAIAGVAGGITGGVGAFCGPGAVIVTNTVVSEGQYVGTELVNGRMPTLQGATTALATGFIGGSLSGAGDSLASAAGHAADKLTPGAVATATRYAADVAVKPATNFAINYGTGLAADASDGDGKIDWGGDALKAAGSTAVNTAGSHVRSGMLNDQYGATSAAGGGPGFNQEVQTFKGQVSDVGARVSSYVLPDPHLLALVQ